MLPHFQWICIICILSSPQTTIILAKGSCIRCVDQCLALTKQLKVIARARDHANSNLGVATTVFVNTKYRLSMLKRTKPSAVLTHWSCYTRSSNLTGSTLDSRETRDSWFSFLTSRSLSTGHSALWNKRVDTSITLQWEQMALAMGKVSIGRNGTSQKMALKMTVNEWI